MRSSFAVVVVVVALAGGAVMGQERFGVRVDRSSGAALEIDERTSTFRISVPVEQDFGDRGGAATAPLFASLEKLAGGRGGLFVSVAVLEAAAKRFDDRLYASIETLLASGGQGAFRGKAALLRDVLARVGNAGDQEAILGARARLVAALELLAAPANADEAVRTRASALVADFDADPKRSKPLGFYTWSEVLSRGFRSDRFLQEVGVPERGGAWIGVLGAAVASDAALRADYERVLRVAARLSNPLAAPDALAATLGEGAFFPASRTREGELFKQIYGEASIPKGRDLMDDFIAAIRKGTVSLAPGPDSGWYDYQTWALEPLVNEKAALEAAKIRRESNYAKLCEEVFKATLTKRRETHVKQLEVPTVGAAAPGREPVRIVTVSPNLRVEPQLTYLRRTADAYAFVRRELVAIFGEAVLGAAPLITPEGASGPAILAALAAQEAKFRGFAALVATEIGAAPALVGEGVDEARALELASLGAAALEPAAMKDDLAYDPRVMVPVAYDLERKRLRCWAVVGVASRPAWISYLTSPAVVVRDAAGRSAAASNYRIEFGTQGVRLPYEAWIECAVKAPLSREEFRALCDRFRTAAEIKAALEAL